ncbi:MAG: replication factor C large subunit [Thermoplasmatota archaeon]
MDWTERHRPTSLKEIVGNGPAVRQLGEWAQSWVGGIPKQRALILAGPPGVGKTSAALALAADMGWQVVELNASDARNATAIKRVATAGALHQTFNDDGSFHAVGTDAGRKLIVLDEADNLTERLSGENAAGGSGSGDEDLSDRGGKAAILDTIRRTQQPIVLIVNDLYALQKGSGAALRTLAATVKFNRVNVRSIPKALDGVARKEGIKVDRDVLETIAARAGGDLRAAVRDLQSLAAGRGHVSSADLGSLGFRDATGTPFDLVKHVLKGHDMDAVRREARNVDITPEDIALWIDENIPKAYRHPRNLVAAYESLSRADVFLGRTRRRQYFGLWSYAGELATVGVQAARVVEERPQRGGGFQPFGFPQYLMKMSRSRGRRQAQAALAGAIGKGTHASQRKVRDGTLQAVEALFASDPEFAAHRTHEWDLTDDQVAHLLGAGAKDKAVKEIREKVKELQAIEAEAAKGAAVRRGPLDGPLARASEPKPARSEAKPAEAKPEPEPEPEPEKPKRPKPAGGQAKLF